jgi:excisionase family DNA binding protein
MLPKIDNYGDILSVKDVCEILGIGANNAYKILAKGEIINFKIGSVRKIPKQCLQEYINNKIARSHSSANDT